MSDRYILARDYANARGLSVDAFITQLINLEKKYKRALRVFVFRFIMGRLKKDLPKSDLENNIS